VSVDSIDGVGGFKASAGPCVFRNTGSPLPVLGRMWLDTADLASVESRGMLQGLIRHELGHTLGMTALWVQLGLRVNPSTAGMPGVDTYYAGSNGIAGFDLIGGSSYTGGNKVPVENTGPTGTINVHWRESVLANELMTGYLDEGYTPLSQLTVRSLIDLGYTVDTAKADPFFLTLSLRAGGPAPGALPLGDDAAEIPPRWVDAKGRLTWSR
jgi:hypothetical protein